MRVFAGQTIGNFDDRELQAIRTTDLAKLKVAKAEQEKLIEVKYAAEGLRMAMIEHTAMVQANKNVVGTFPDIEVKKAELAVAQASANLELQKYTLEVVKVGDTNVAESELARAEVLIELRKIYAPIDGIIVDIKSAEGKWLREGDPVLHIENLDTLWVQVFVDARRYTESDIMGKPATIRATLANGKVEMFEGHVFFCDQKIDANYNFLAYLEIQNRRVGDYWLLRHGYCNVDITIQL
jgi:multidrug resistance efflux pump